MEKSKVANSRDKPKTSAFKKWYGGYKNDVKKVYRYSRIRGYQDYDNLPPRRGIIIVATNGYYRGLSDRRKVIKLQNKNKENN